MFFFPQNIDSERSRAPDVPQGRFSTAHSTMKAHSQFPCTLAEAKSPYFSVVWGVINQRPFIFPTTGHRYAAKSPQSPQFPHPQPGFPPPLGKTMTSALVLLSVALVRGGINIIDCNLKKKNQPNFFKF